MKTGRNEPCPCGSGKKYKRCCMLREQSTSLGWRRMERLAEKLSGRLATHAERYYGPGWLADAWFDFTLGDGTPFDEDGLFADALDEDDLPVEFDTFSAWCPYSWIPETAGLDPEDSRPQMPIALHYLEHRQSRTDTLTRRFIEAACAQPFSFYMVRGLEPGRTVTLRDMLRRRDYEVHEQVDAAAFPRGAILYAQVVTLDGDSILLGCAPYTLPPAWAEDVIDLREEWGIEPDAPAEALAGRGAELRALYFDLQEALLDPEPPLIENADGDPVQLTLLHYDLRCTPQEASDALLPLARGLDRDEPRQTDAAGKLVTVSFPWAREGATRKDAWADAALGQIRIDGARMEVFADSARRVDAFQRECEARLGDRAALRDTEVVDDLGELPDWTYPDDAEGEDQLDAETAAALLEELAEAHWERWPDEPLPELKDQTPREAARTEIGRERLEAVLWQLEELNLGTVFDADTEKLRRVLGLD